MSHEPSVTTSPSGGEVQLFDIKEFIDTSESSDNNNSLMMGDGHTEHNDTGTLMSRLLEEMMDGAVVEDSTEQSSL